MSNKTALITGVTGQDGAYLAELLLDKGYTVHGIKRRSSSFNTHRIDHLYQDPFENNPKFILHYGDMTDSTNLLKIVQKTKPDEIYNLAAQSHVQVSFESPEYTANSDALGTLRILEAIRVLDLQEKTKFYQASTSELYGLVRESPQNENTPFYPRSPYACAKLYAYWITVNYREAYGMFAANGILFNHESPLRGETFVTRKITRALARIVFGFQEECYLGNLNAKRDWGHARDYVEAQWRILQQEKPDDFVIATGKHYSVREFVDHAAKSMGLALQWKGEGLDEVGIISAFDPQKLEELVRHHAEKAVNLKPGTVIIRVNKRYFRPTEVETLLGDPTKAKEQLGWEPTSSFMEMVREMAQEDLMIVLKDSICQQSGFKVLNFIE